MNRSIPEYLRLHVEESVQPDPLDDDKSVDALDRLCQSFRSATGWSLEHGLGKAPLQSPDVLWARTLDAQSASPNHLAIRRSAGKTPDELQNELLPLCDLVDSIADLAGELHRTRAALVQREAELAVGIPLVASPGQQQQHLAVILQEILRAGAEAVGAQAASLFLLDEGTSELKMRSSWGLPQERLTAPARPLRGALADLEALTGHAVVIEDTRLLPHWRVPEDFAAAVCLPVSSPTTPLGTVWFFCQKVRDFSEQETNLLEVVAGRIATELERQLLLSEVVLQRQPTTSLAQIAPVPTAEPPLSPVQTESWEIAAIADAGSYGVREFFDWQTHEDGSLTVAMASEPLRADSHGSIVQLIRGAAKSGMLRRASPETLVREVADVTWNATCGDRSASLAVLHLPVKQAEVQFCSAGPLGALVIRPTRPSAIAQAALPLGRDPEATYYSAPHQVEVGDAVALVSDSVRNATNGQGLPLGEAAIADCLRECLSQSAETMAAAVQSLLQKHRSDEQFDFSENVILIARRMA